MAPLCAGHVKMALQHSQGDGGPTPPTSEKDTRMTMIHSAALRRGLLAAGMIASLAGTALPADAADPAAGTWRYTVFRDGSPIGDHAITFTPAGDQLQVDIKTDIAVKIAFVTAFRFEHSSREVWQGGRLQSLTATTNDDGSKHTVTAKAEGGVLQVTADGGTSSRPAETLIHDQWNTANLKAPALLSAFDGTDYKVSTSGPQAETVEIGSHSFKARKYSVSGDLVRSFWFDDQDRLLKVAFESRGSNVVYEFKP